jgi:cytochrome c biogenesis protein CcmG/thiol:disulfide interchange protein DsbE
VYGAPETFLVDANGIVRWKHVGPLSDVVIANELIPALQRAEASR